MGPITPQDYGKWETLGSGVLSLNGEWLAALVTKPRVNQTRFHGVLAYRDVGQGREQDAEASRPTAKN